REATPQIELLEDFDFLLLTRGKTGYRHVERNLERNRAHECIEALALFAPVDHQRDIVPRHHQVLGDRHARHEGEVLVHHADTERMGVLWRTNLAFTPVHDDLARIRAVVADQALDQRALAGTVLAQQRVERSGRYRDRDVVERDEAAEALGHVQTLDLERGIRWRFGGRNLHSSGEGLGARGAGDRDQTSASMSDFEFDTAPNTPPCIFTILIAAR